MTQHSPLPPPAAAETEDEFVARHIGPDDSDQARMLSVIGAATRRELMDTIVPAAIRRQGAMQLPAAASEPQALAELRSLAAKNKVLRSFIGQGYHDTHTPGVIQRNILENPAWYTAYTPYQAEISQGRLEALVNFQTMVCDLTGHGHRQRVDARRSHGRRRGDDAGPAQRAQPSNRIIVAGDCHPQTIEVLRTRAEPLGLEVMVGFAPGS
jgi:glycine dehydrogenase